jgi:polyisoprenoid-binding protein YceI
MPNSRRNILIGVIALVVLAAAAVAFIWFSGGSGEPSATISAPTLDIAARPTDAATAEVTEEAATTEATEQAEPTQEATTAAAAATATPEPTAEPTSSLVVFNIVADASEVRFILDEDLRGERVTVVGSTNQVAGQIAVDFAAPATSQVGVIRINVRSLATDNEFRNRAIRGQILQSSQDQFEFAQFTPTEVSGLPDEVAMGEAFTFEITGDLQIRDITNPVTFEVTVTPVSETRIEGSAATVVTRESYGLTIPSVPGVANVEEEVEIEIDFVAEAE